MGFVYIDTKDAIRRVRAGFNELSKDQLYKSIARAINATLNTTRTQIKRRVRDVYNLPASNVEASILVIRSNYGNLTGKISLTTTTIPLKEFNPTQREGQVITRQVGGKKGGLASKLQKRKPDEAAYALTVEVVKGEVKSLPSAYFKIAASGNSRVMARGEYARGFQFDQTQHLSTLRSISMYSVVVGGKIHKEMRSYIDITFDKNLTRELNLRLAEVAKHGKP